MTLNEFKALIAQGTPEDVIRQFLEQPSVVAVGSADNYAAFKVSVMAMYKEALEVHIVGSGCWEYSLNPVNHFSRFSSQSDIDVAVVSQADFTGTWETLREHHRSNWYRLSPDAQLALNRNGQNVYAGFVSPKWITDKRNPLRFEFMKILNQLSGPLVGYRTVNMLFFKSRSEMIDYYKRGVVIARRELRQSGL